MSINLRTLALALVLLGLMLGLTLLVRQPPAPLGVDAPEDQFSAGRALLVLRDLLADETPHPAGSEANARVRDRIVEKLRAIGYETNIQHATIERDGRQIDNLICRLPGQESGPAVMLVAHYDSAPQGPGAADDGSGVAVVVEAARILKAAKPFRNSIVFLITDGEEAGLWGTKAFVNEHPWAKEIAAAVNLEARGTSGRSLMFETSENNAWLISAYAAAVKNPDTSSLEFEIYRRMPNDTDLSILKKAGMAGMNFAFIRNVAYYHTAGDNLAHLDPGSLQHQGDNALAMIKILAAMDLSHPPLGNAIYTDLLGLTMIRWPERWAIPLAALASLLIAGTIYSLLRTQTMSPRSLICGLIAWPVLVAAPVLLGIGLKWSLSGSPGSQNLWFAYPTLARAALWSEVLLVVILLTFFWSRWSGCWGLWSGVWIWWSIATLAVSACLPGASCLLLIPLAVASVACIFVRCTKLRDRPWAIKAAFTLAALFVALFWIKCALGMEDVMGLRFTPGITAPLALAMVAIAPIWMPNEKKAEIIMHGSA